MTADLSTLVAGLLREQPLTVALLILLLEIPQYSFSILALAVSSLKGRPAVYRQPDAKISVIVPVYNGQPIIAGTVRSLMASDCDFAEVFIVNDGSTDNTAGILARLQDEFPGLTILNHSLRTGKSAAINHAARFATGDFLLVVDADVIAEPQSVGRLAAAMADPQVAAAGGNILVGNKRDNPLTAIQSMEYLLSISMGRLFLDYIGSVNCCSGAFTIFRASAFRAVGGMNVGPGEDLEITLRLRKAGYKVRFAREAIVKTRVPDTIRALVRQRLRWDRDAISIRLFMYHQMSLRQGREALADTLQRLDFILLELLPTLVFPFYLCYLLLYYQSAAWALLLAFYIGLFWLSLANLVLAFITTRRTPAMLDWLIFPLVPAYQGVFGKILRWHAYTSEILFAPSHRDNFVPRRIRQALYGDRGL